MQNDNDIENILAVSIIHSACLKALNVETPTFTYIMTNTGKIQLVAVEYLLNETRRFFQAIDPDVYGLKDKNEKTN